MVSKKKHITSLQVWRPSRTWPTNPFGFSLTPCLFTCTLSIPTPHSFSTSIPNYSQFPEPTMYSRITVTLHVLVLLPRINNQFLFPHCLLALHTWQTAIQLFRLYSNCFLLDGHCPLHNLPLPASVPSSVRLSNRYSLLFLLVCNHLFTSLPPTLYPCFPLLPGLLHAQHKEDIQ